MIKCKFHDWSEADLVAELKKISQEAFSLRMQKYVQRENVGKRHRQLKLFKAQILTVLTAKKNSENK